MPATTFRVAVVVVVVLAVLMSAGCASRATDRPPLIAHDKVVDLSHTFGPDTVYWPTAEPFKLRRVAYGRTPRGYWYVANNLSMAEHGGTHMDAPIHFAEGKITAAEVPLASCIGPAVVIDVSQQAARDRDYRLSVADIENFERRHG